MNSSFKKNHISDLTTVVLLTAFSISFCRRHYSFSTVALGVCSQGVVWWPWSGFLHGWLVVGGCAGGQRWPWSRSGVDTSDPAAEPRQSSSGQSRDECLPLSFPPAAGDVCSDSHWTEFNDELPLTENGVFTIVHLHYWHTISYLVL